MQSIMFHMSMQTMKIPPIGQTVMRRRTSGDDEAWFQDYVAQIRTGGEQSVLVWGSDRARFGPDEIWLWIWKQ